MSPQLSKSCQNRVTWVPAKIGPSLSCLSSITCCGNLVLHRVLFHWVQWETWRNVVNCNNSLTTWGIVGIRAKRGKSWGFVGIRGDSWQLRWVEVISWKTLWENAGNRGETQENVPNRGNSWEIHRNVGIREKTWGNVNSLETNVRKHEKSWEFMGNHGNS